MNLHSNREKMASLWTLHKSWVVISLLMTYVLQCSAQTECGSHLTVKDLEVVVQGRCLDFQRTVQTNLCANGIKNCNDLWTKFNTSFAEKPQCNITANFFDDFIAAADHDINGTQLFWSGVWGFAQKYSDGGKRYTTLEDTMIGYLLNGLSFCGGEAGSNSSLSCPSRDADKCPNTASGAFWTAASLNFAKKASGHVYVLLNATKDPVFKSSSYFWSNEVPTLRAGFVERLSAILINDSPSTKRDPCANDEMLQQLKSNLTTRNINFDCVENPRDLVNLYCVDNPTSEVCGSSGLTTGSATSVRCRNIFLIQLVFLMIFAIQ